MVGIVYVSKDMVIESIQNNYPDLTEITKDKHYPNVWNLKRKGGMGWYISVKVPDPNVYGHAIHINVRCIYKNSKGLVDMQIYPKEAKGRSHFISKSIPREKNWENSLNNEIQEGVKIYNMKFVDKNRIFFDSNGHTFTYSGSFNKEFEANVHFLVWVQKICNVNRPFPNDTKDRILGYFKNNPEFKGFVNEHLQKQFNMDLEQYLDNYIKGKIEEKYVPYEIFYGVFKENYFDIWEYKFDY